MVAHRLQSINFCIHQANQREAFAPCTGNHCFTSVYSFMKRSMGCTHGN
ncbi:Uncharacterised protein [Klebsiella quasipneumoniae]|nr:Uncharacterised protein [Klebsiella quasipneumoniae]